MIFPTDATPCREFEKNECAACCELSYLDVITIKDGARRDLSFETIAAHAGSAVEQETGALSFPIYQTATFRHDGLDKTTGYDYSRLQNPTRAQVETTVATLEGGRFGFAFSTGMAAISAVFRSFSIGSHLIFSEDIYGGTYRLITEVYARSLEFSFVDTSDLAKVADAIRPETVALFIETPTNPMSQITDIEAIARLAGTHDLITIVDNTFLTPYFQKPLLFGADVVVHSGTKFLCGHNDTLAGFVVTDDEKIAAELELIQSTDGAPLAPFDSWLALRGIKTLPLRLEKQQQNALSIARWLKEQDAVEAIYYVGLPEHPGHEICQKQSEGFGSMISFTVDSPERVAQILERVDIIIFAESLGGVETLITYPVTQTHESIPEEIRLQLGITDNLLRLSVGIEDVEDLIGDLEQAIG